MPYSAKILLNSVSPTGIRLTSWELCYPRFIHSELMTHRVFSRNAASSRAIPIEKMINSVRDDLLEPKWWGKNQSGMQAREELIGPAQLPARDAWLKARASAIESAKRLADTGLHKQIVNRVLEPFMFITTIVTATEWTNWFNLRAHSDAQPEIGWLAMEMQRQYKKDIPKKLEPFQWHRPLMPDMEELNSGGWFTNELNLISSGRCARISYLTHSGRRDPEKDIKLSERLLRSGHMSPFEHVAECLDTDMWFGNFRGWKQFRKTIPGESVFTGGN